MCHIIFVLPFASLLLFSFLPFEEALSLFIIINAVCFFLFYKIYVVMRKKPECGISSMVGKEGVVIEPIYSEGRILIDSEIWFARSDENLDSGQRCVVVGLEGLKALVSSKSRDD
jgi:membrane protein implicated in regulation of membrane protease activity